MANVRQSKTKEELVRDFRTAEILDATRRVIADLGATDASMERIATTAGISKGTIYLYFKNKEELLVRALADGFDELMERTRLARDAEPSPEAALAGIARVGLEYSSEHQEFFEALQRGQLANEGADLLAEEVEQQMTRYVGLIADALHRGIDTAHFRKHDTSKSALIFVAALRGAFAEHVRRGGEPQFANDAKTLVDFLLNGIAANGGHA